MTAFSPEQYAFLVAPVQASRVQNLRGQSHLEAWDIRRHLIRAFGFDGFTIETISLDLVREIETKQGERSRWTVVYRAQVRLTIKVDGQPVAVFEDGAAGDSSNQPSLGDAHDMALKTALSQGLKRCAVNLGDQFGLSLYNDGKAAPVVNRSLIAPKAVEQPAEPVGANDAPVQPEPAPTPDDTPAPTRSAGPEPMDESQRKRMFAQFGELHKLQPDHGWREADVQRVWVSGVVNREVSSRASLNRVEAGVVIDALVEELTRMKRSRMATAAR